MKTLCDSYAIDIYAFDPMGKILCKKKGRNLSDKVTLVFMIDEAHVYPVLDWKEK